MAAAHRYIAGAPCKKLDPRKAPARTLQAFDAARENPPDWKEAVPRDVKQTARELAVFGRFLEAHASLAADVACYSPAPGDFPDICVRWEKADGATGFELGEWLHAQQMAGAKCKTLRTKLREVLSQRIKERPRNIKMVALEVIDTTFCPTDVDAFATELWRMVSELDEAWERDPSEQQLYPLRDFTSYPTVGKYVRSIVAWSPNSHLERVISEPLSDPEIPWERLPEELKAQIGNPGLPTTDEQQTSWIEFPLDGGAYSSQSALQALTNILDKKTKKYAAQQGGGGLRLIIYYDEAVLYNTPYEVLGHETFADMAREAARMLTGKDVAPFNRIYLLRALWPNPEAFEVWPSFSKCG